MLPELPKRLKRREADFGLRFRQWAEEHKDWLPDACSFELKDTRGAGSLPFNHLEPKQRRFAGEIQSDGTLIRVTVGTPGTADYLFMKETAVAYVVINYPGSFCVIEAAKFLKEEERGDRKSLTEERARKIAKHVILTGRQPKNIAGDV